MAHGAPECHGRRPSSSSAISACAVGRLERPILDADTIVADNGRISAIGRAKDVDTGNATTSSTRKGSALVPGLIDSHVHPVAGDWTPRQNQIGWIDSLPAWRRHHHDLGGRGASPGRPDGHRRPQGARDHRATSLSTPSARPASRCIAGAPVSRRAWSRRISTSSPPPA